MLHRSSGGAKLSPTGLYAQNRRRQQMHFRQLGIITLASALGFGLSSGAAFAQDAKQDIKNAGTETKDATKDVGHGVAKGTKKAYHSTTHGTKVAADKTADASKTVAHKTAAGTKKTVDKVEDKPAPK
jgi:hypothetical protein